MCAILLHPRNLAPGGCLLTLLLVLPVHAQAPLRPWVAEVGDARSVVVLGGAEQSALCRDDGQSGDPVAGDDRWSCQEMTWNPSQDPLAVMLDGQRLVQAQAIPPDPGETVTLQVDGNRLLVTDGAPAPGEAGEPRSPRPALIIDVDRGESPQAWILEVTSNGTTEQLACHDDGDFPDAVRNDHVPVCAGAVDPGEVRLRLRTPDREDRAVMALGPEVSIFSGRWTAKGLEKRVNPLLVKPDSTAAALPSGESLPAPRGGEDPGNTPAVKPPDAPARPGLWAGLLALAAGLVGWRLGRGARPDRGLHPSLERLEQSPRFEHLPSVAQAWEALGRESPVVLVQVDQSPPETHLGAVLRCRSRDVLDVVDAVRGLADRDPLCTIGLVLGDPAGLVHPGGLGVEPLEVLARHLPPGTLCIVVKGNAVG